MMKNVLNHGGPRWSFASYLLAVLSIGCLLSGCFSGEAEIPVLEKESANQGSTPPTSEKKRPMPLPPEEQSPPPKPKKLKTVDLDLDRDEIRREKYTVEHQDGFIIFLRYSNKGDGDCGLWGIEMDRRDLADQFLNRLHSHRPILQRMLAQELRSHSSLEAYIETFRNNRSYWMTFQQNTFPTGDLPDIYSPVHESENESLLAAAAMVNDGSITSFRIKN